MQRGERGARPRELDHQIRSLDSRWPRVFHLDLCVEPSDGRISSRHLVRCDRCV